MTGPLKKLLLGLMSRQDQHGWPCRVLLQRDAAATVVVNKKAQAERTGLLIHSRERVSSDVTCH